MRSKCRACGVVIQSPTPTTCLNCKIEPIEKVIDLIDEELKKPDILPTTAERFQFVRRELVRLL